MALPWERKRPFLQLSILVFGFNPFVLGQESQQFANLGDFKLASGEVIRDCRVGYRTFGTQNADQSNIVLMLTWFGGRTEQLGSSLGPGKRIDTSKYFVVAIDASRQWRFQFTLQPPAPGAYEVSPVHFYGHDQQPA
jgi:hypothetical protein